MTAGLFARSAARAEAGQRSVIIIGAGLAGLAAARKLKSEGFRVKVLESRDRIGGRIWTSRLWRDLPMDLGASWIHGTTGNPLTAFSDEIGARRLRTSYESAMMLDVNGKTLDGIDEAMADAEAFMKRARSRANNSGHDLALSDALTSSSDWKSADGSKRRLIRHYVNSTVEQEYGCDWTEASAWYFDDSAEDFDGGDVLFPDGFDQVPRHLAKGIDIALGQRVTALAPHSQGVAVTLSNGSTMLADHAVITVPLGVLQSGALRFAEKLDDRRANAIAGLGMGLLNKCWLRFERIAWPDTVDWIEWLGPEDGHWAEWVSLARATRAPVLLGFHAGAQARDLEQYDDTTARALAHEALKAMFGNSFPKPVDAQITRWSKDQDSLGSYSFNAVGTSSKTRKALQGEDWDGRLVFAGEAASPDYFGTAHGALLSGLHSANLLARA